MTDATFKTDARFEGLDYHALNAMLNLYTPIRVKKLRNAKHIFSHIEWHMTAYEVIVDELEKNCKEEMIFAHPEEIQKEYSMPSAFSAWKVK